MGLHRRWHARHRRAREGGAIVVTQEEVEEVEGAEGAEAAVADEGEMVERSSRIMPGRSLTSEDITG